MSTARPAPTTAVVVGNPKAGSRTLTAATYVARELTGADPDLVVDLATIGPELVDWRASAVNDLVAQVGRADLVVVACPTYKATYTGLLKLFLDRFSVGQLSGVAVPLMLGAGPAHALAPELGLRPLLTHLGALVPTPGLYVLEEQYDAPAAYAEWLAGAGPAVTALLSRPRGATA
ncbi:NAD(P)H-dependent oxidoreductase [Nocardioides humilatus]|uniref:NAD(P)H-dependent oxidoreductase n=1 Tax=Nocardioides humilatus TaxID=2607660 RepID=A0A5B1LD30_9ACTN|nr:NAD(P)H-dependent oxidoreductase [Nocardioides humilatus]KAA1418555.1 NAD(P)H-dependent oxidoreductase [Nocardioides humilatus]